MLSSLSGSKKYLKGIKFILFCNIALAACSAQATIRVAVASNFSAVAAELADAFVKTGQDEPILLSGSMAADQDRPRLLEQRGYVVDNSRVTYANGRLVLLINPQVPSKLTSLSEVKERVLESSHIAIANPKLAPYGLAAMQFFTSLNIGQSVSSRLVMGENITQAFQFVQTGNADIGLVARSQISTLPAASLWVVPDDLHEPIRQQMVLLSESQQAHAFYEFIKSDAGLEIILKHGYDAPDD